MGNTKPITQDKQFPMRVDDEFLRMLDELRRNEVDVPPRSTWSSGLSKGPMRALPPARRKKR